MRRRLVIVLTAVLAGQVGFSPVGAQEAPPAGYAPHSDQQRLIAPQLASKQYEVKPIVIPAAAPGRRSTPSINTKDFVVLGYVQLDTTAHQYPWQSLTHVASEFVPFGSTGSLTSTSGWTGRAAELKPGGAADTAGVKVLMTIQNSGFSTSVFNSVMQNNTYRQTLANNIAAIVNNTSDNCAGVNLDFEPFDSGTPSATVNGVIDFLHKLRTACNMGKEISIYLGGTYYSNFGTVFSGAIDDLDFVNFSCYPWSGSWSRTAIGVAPQSSYQTQVDRYLSHGCPPDKLVLTLPSYGEAFNTATGAYGASVDRHLGAFAYCDAKWATTLSATLRTREYQSGAETPWFTYFNGSDYTTYLYDDEISLATKIRAARSWIGAIDSGRRLRGVGFWSLMWMSANYNTTTPFYSWDMEQDSLQNKNRTYPQIYQATLEMLAPPGTRTYPIEKWEGLDYRWRDNNASTYDRKDDVNCTYGVATRALAATPSGTGRPSNSTNCMKVNFNFYAANGRLLFRYEILGHQYETTKADLLAAKGYFDLNSKVMVDVYTPTAYSGRSVRMVLMDKNGELEQSRAFALNTVGWQSLTWDLRADPVSAFTTNFNEYKSGNGVIDTAGPGARDLAIIGFLIQGGSSAGSGSVYFDELRWTHTPPDGKSYVINEFRYNGVDKEFVEIYGPAGALPAGFELRLMQGGNSTPTVIPLPGQSVPDDGGGFGYLVVGDPDTPNVDYSTGFSATADDFPDVSPGAIQLYDTSTGYVYDSAVYRAMGGMGTLTRPFADGVTDNGYPWIGEGGPGSNASGTVYTLGRYPDGANTYVNFADFSVMPATPGAPNGNSIALPVTYDFTTAPPNAFQTYQSFVIADPTAAGLPASPGGGKAHRCVDVSGGGVMSFFGDAALGAGDAGYTASGEIYIPTSSEPAQADAIGLCGRQGSTFFTNTPGSSGYESGYMLIYENAVGVGLNDGLADHPGTFRFVYATNDNMDGTPVTELGSATLAATGATAGAWATFDLTIDPSAAAGSQLVAKINGATIYSGAIPAGGPTSGAFQVGFRENHTGTPANSEGTWIDDLTLEPAGSVVIDSQPVSITRIAGQSATFSVLASGTSPLHYQWHEAGTPDRLIPDATSKDYTIQSVTLGDAGQYYCHVYNTASSADSTAATLTVESPVIANNWNLFIAH